MCDLELNELHVRLCSSTMEAIVIGAILCDSDLFHLVNQWVYETKWEDEHRVHRQLEVFSASDQKFRIVGRWKSKEVNKNYLYLKGLRQESTFRRF